MVQVATVLAIVQIVEAVTQALNRLAIKGVAKAIDTHAEFTFKVKELEEIVDKLSVIKESTQLELSKELRNQACSMAQLLEEVKQLTHECKSISWWNCCKRHRYLKKLLKKEALLGEELIGLSAALMEELLRMHSVNSRLQDENSRLQDKNSRLQDVNSRLQDENSRLQDENSKLTQRLERIMQERNAYVGIVNVVRGLQNIVPSIHVGIHPLFRWISRIHRRGGAADIERYLPTIVQTVCGG